MINTLKEVMKQTVATFRKCCLPVVGINIGLFILTFVLIFIVLVILGKDFINGLAMLSINPVAVSGILPQLGIFLVLLLVIFALFYFAAVWLLFVIKNNVLLGKSLFKSAFFESCRKVWKLFVWGIMLFIAFMLVGTILGLILGKYSAILFIPIVLVCVPCIYTISFGLMFLDGNFTGIISQSFTLGLKKWGRILVIYIVSVIVLLLCLRLSGLSQILFAKVGFAPIGKLINAVLNMFIQAFAYCFFTVFYLKIAGITAPANTEQIPQK